MSLPNGPVGPLPSAVQQLANALCAAGQLNRPRPLLPPPATPAQAAERLGVAMGQMACTTRFRRSHDNASLLTVTAADRQVDLRKLEALAGGGYVPVDVGTVTPVPSDGLTVLIDESLQRFEAVWLNAGHPAWWFSTTTEQLQRWAGTATVALACDVAATELAMERRLRLLVRSRAVVASASEDVPSPCISVCRVDSATGQCTGCFRTLSEISRWARSDPDAQRALWLVLGERAQAAASS